MFPSAEMGTETLGTSAAEHRLNKTNRKGSYVDPSCPPSDSAFTLMPECCRIGRGARYGGGHSRLPTAAASLRRRLWRTRLDVAPPLPTVPSTGGAGAAMRGGARQWRREHGRFGHRYCSAKRMGRLLHSGSGSGQNA